MTFCLDVPLAGVGQLRARRADSRSIEWPSTSVVLGRLALAPRSLRGLGAVAAFAIGRRSGAVGAMALARRPRSPGASRSLRWPCPRDALRLGLVCHVGDLPSSSWVAAPTSGAGAPSIPQSTPRACGREPRVVTRRESRSRQPGQFRGTGRIGYTPTMIGVTGSWDSSAPDVAAAEQLAEQAALALRQADVQPGPVDVDGRDVVLRAVDREAAAELVHRDVGTALDEPAELGRRAAGRPRSSIARPPRPGRRRAVGRLAAARHGAGARGRGARSAVELAPAACGDVRDRRRRRRAGGTRRGRAGAGLGGRRPRRHRRAASDRRGAATIADAGRSGRAERLGRSRRRARRRRMAVGLEARRAAVPAVAVAVGAATHRGLAGTFRRCAEASDRIHGAGAPRSMVNMPSVLVGAPWAGRTVAPMIPPRAAARRARRAGPGRRLRCRPRPADRGRTG